MICFFLNGVPVRLTLDIQVIDIASAYLTWNEPNSFDVLGSPTSATKIAKVAPRSSVLRGALKFASHDLNSVVLQMPKGWS